MMSVLDVGLQGVDAALRLRVGRGLRVHDALVPAPEVLVDFRTS